MKGKNYWVEKREEKKEREGILTRAREREKGREKTGSKREKEEIGRREGEERRRGNWSVSTNQDTQILKGKQTKCIINAEQ